MTTHTPIHLPPSTCPFCAISALHPPLSPHTTAPDSPQWTPANLPYQQNPSYLLLSTPDVIAFLDIMPLTKGHVLVVPRKHVVRMGELEVGEAGKVFRLLPLLARAVMRSILPDREIEDYNIIQNNGVQAGQVVPHLHFHIIPRPPLDLPSSSPPSPLRIPTSASRRRNTTTTTTANTTTNPLYTIQYHPDRTIKLTPLDPSASSPSSTPSSTTNTNNPVYSIQHNPRRTIKLTDLMSSRGQRDDLDDDEAEALVRVMRGKVAEEWEREFGEGRGSKL